MAGFTWYAVLVLLVTGPAHLALTIYSAIFYLLLPAVFLRLLWRSIREPEYRADPLQRLGFFQSAWPGEIIWVHAVSAGETIAAIPLIERLVEKGHRCLVTNMTPTGRDRCRKLLAHLGDRVENCYAPYDLPGAVRRFIRRNRPAKLVIVDTELWPNMLHQARAAGMETILVNGRMSEQSAAGYRRMAFVTRRMMRSLNVVAAQTRRHGERFVSLGAPQGRVHVTGSIKFDAPGIDAEKVERARQVTGGRRVIVGASTHPGEEAALLAALPALIEVAPDLVLVLAPRHTHRASEVRELSSDSGFNPCSFTDGKPLSPDGHVFVLDVMGELQAYLAVAGMAFVGGSLVPVGGHNLLEAVRGEAAVVMGKHLRNVDDIAGQFVEADAMLIVADSEALQRQLRALLSDEKRRRDMTARATAVMSNNRGALDRVMELLNAR